jgi:hypothetical protein
MKVYKKSETGLILFSVFLVSTVFVLIINFFNLLPNFTRMVLVYVWLAEFMILIGWVCLFHNLRQFADKR